LALREEITLPCFGAEVAFGRPAHWLGNFLLWIQGFEVRSWMML
jgi:hypothetical protein